VLPTPLLRYVSALIWCSRRIARRKTLSENNSYEREISRDRVQRDTVSAMPPTGVSHTPAEIAKRDDCAYSLRFHAAAKACTPTLLIRKSSAKRRPASDEPRNPRPRSSPDPKEKTQ